MSDAYRRQDGGFRLERLASGWLVGRFAALEAIGVTHMVTTREGPDVQQVRRDPATAGAEIARMLGLQDVAFLDQVHGGDVLVCERGGCAGSADGLVTATKGLTLLAKSGDCPIVLIGDRRGRALGFAHASWRATVANVTMTAIHCMVDLGCDPADLVVCICPSAGPECYEVGDDVYAAAIQEIGPHAERFFRPGSGEKKYFDLWHANACAAARAGLSGGSIHVAGVCTLCRNDLFPSHRREGDSAGRFAAVIGWVPPTRE